MGTSMVSSQSPPPWPCSRSHPQAVCPSAVTAQGRVQPLSWGRVALALQDPAMPWAHVLLSALFSKDYLYSFSRTECESNTQYQGSFGGQVHATHFFLKIILAQLLYLKVCTESEPLATEPCMYLQEWLSIPVCSLLGINLVGNHKMVEVVDLPESILLFSSFCLSFSG